MSWEMELYNLYDRFYGKDTSPVQFTPIAHLEVCAQLEITVDADGNFKDVAVVPKDEAKTLVPVTVDSATRSNDNAPHMLMDKLMYVAGDYGAYVKNDRRDATAYYNKYKQQLCAWCESNYTDTLIQAVYKYIVKGTVISDCVSVGALQVDADGALDAKHKVNGIAQDSLTVRFIVQDGEDEYALWRSEKLQNLYIAYVSATMTDKQLCYVTGKELASTYRHPNKLRNSSDRAKIVSAADTTCFTYRGEFRDKYEAISVSYEWSQKAHNALRCLIAERGKHYNDICVVMWRSDLQEIPDFVYTNVVAQDIEASVNEEAYMSIIEETAQRLIGDTQEKTMLMMLGAATQGRMSVMKYCELQNDAFIELLKKWWLKTATVRYNVGQNKVQLNSTNLYEIVLCAFGTEDKQVGKFTAPTAVDTYMRMLIPCVFDGVKIPYNVAKALYHRASNPMLYKERYNHRRVLETACSVIREQGEGKWPLLYDAGITDRSYLYGCLLAIADEAERRAFNKEDKKARVTNARVTNARKYWSMFAKRPYYTWEMLYKHLQPYIKKLGGVGCIYEEQIQSIITKMDCAGYRSNNALEPQYLLGFSQYSNRYAGKETCVEEINNEE